MLISYSKIVNSSILELKTQALVGEVSEIVIQKTELQIAGIVLKNNFLTFKKTAISSNDIVEITSSAVLVSDVDAVLNLNEAIRIKEAYDTGFHGNYQRVKTKNGKSVGVVYDYLIDSQTLNIMKFYIRTLMTEKIITRDSIIELKGKNLIIKDDFEKVKFSPPITESSVI